MNIFSQETEKQLSNEIIQLVMSTMETFEKQKNRKRRYLKQYEALDYCNISKETLRKWVREMGLKEIKIDGVVLYDITDLDVFILRHKI